MEPQCFQEKQTSYLQHRRAKWDKTWKIASSKALKEKMPDWGMQTTPIKYKTSQALLLKLWDLLKSFQTIAQTEILQIRFATHTHTQKFPLLCKEQDSTIATIPPRACPYTWAGKRWDDITNYFPAFRTCPHLKTVATWAQKLSSHCRN